tara:strand:- start:438 stop:617 length:180 start_codon:yes stop_codon:yes gene_type:complete
MRDLDIRIIQIGVKKTKIAELLGVAPSYLSNFLKGSQNFSKKKIERLDYIVKKYENIKL